MSSDRDPASAKVISPFANAEASVPQSVPEKSNRAMLWVLLIVVTVAVGGAVGWTVNKYLTDPFRTLEAFSVSKYLEGPTNLLGSRFKADLRVEAVLGWKENIGSLMLFSVAGETNPIAVMVPAAISRNVSFTKGQTYLAELEVKEGGLIYANNVRKN